MSRLIKKPTKRIQSLCKRYKVKLTVKHGSKRVYKSKRLLMKQLRKKMRSRKQQFGKRRRPSRRRSGFGLKKDCGCGFGKKKRGLRRSGFGLKKDCGCGFGKKKRGLRRSRFGTHKSSDIKKLHRLCKVYHIKIGNKSPKVLRKQCLKKAITLLKKYKKNKRN